MNTKLLTTLALIATFAVGTVFGTSMTGTGQSLSAASGSSTNMPNSPTDLVAKLVTKNGKNVIQLDWKDNSTNEKYFQIKKKMKLGNNTYNTYEWLADTANNDHNYDYKESKWAGRSDEDRTFTFHVRAIGPALNSEWSNAISINIPATTPAPKPKPTLPGNPATGQGAGTGTVPPPGKVYKPSLTITSPSVYKSYVSLKDTLQVRWTSTDITPNAVVEIGANFEKDNGEGKYVKFGTSANDGSEDFVVPSGWPNGLYNNLIIKSVVCMPNPTVTCPNGNDSKTITAVTTNGFKILPKN
jgi:hypothetical protein